jgi:monoamine oxidase
MLDLLGRPVNGRLLLAGEQDSARTGYADGAYATGLRAAVRLGA